MASTGFYESMLTRDRCLLLPFSHKKSKLRPQEYSNEVTWVKRAKRGEESSRKRSRSYLQETKKK